MPGNRLKDIHSFIRTTDRDDVMLNFDGGEAQNARKARGVILNTYDALEQDVVDALRREFPRVYTVGPLATFANAAGGGGLDEIGGNLWKEDTGCLRWLETQRPGSVVYVNFGSITVMTADQLAEFTLGLAGLRLAVPVGHQAGPRLRRERYAAGGVRHGHQREGNPGELVPARDGALAPVRRPVSDVLRLELDAGEHMRRRADALLAVLR